MNRIAQPKNYKECKLGLCYTIEDIEKVKGKLPLKLLVEIGTFKKEWSMLVDYLDDPTKEIWLFEPHPQLFGLLKRQFKDYKNVKVYDTAISKENGIEKFGQSTCGFSSKQPYGYRNGSWGKGSFDVKTATFDKFDNGKIDLLTIDTEGCEFFALKHMSSRPIIVSVETHRGRGSDQNYYCAEIDEMMDLYGYHMHMQFYLDSIYVRNDYGVK